MHSILLSPAALAAARSTAPAASSDPGAALLAATRLLVAGLERGCTIEPQTLRNAISAAFGGSDAAGAWNWKTAYDACEAAQILFLRKFGPAMRKRAASPSAFLVMLEKLAALVPSHTRCSEEGQALQQFSMPIELGFVSSVAAAITSDHLVLEPLAGTWLLPIHAELAGAQLHPNELADARACLLDQLFGGIGVTRYDAAHIHDHLDGDIHPTVVLMNPPFSVAAHVDGRVADAAFRHVAWALVPLADGSRLVTITAASVSPGNPAWRDSFVQLQQRSRLMGYGTGAGKGRQVAGILLDNWIKGRRRAVWISKYDKLINDAQRDWSALGQERLLITPLSRFHPGKPIRLEQGILFTTYATLRSDTREEKLSRAQQIVDWLGRDFDGVILFDESHVMQNAAGEKSERGERAPSLPGRAGLRLQHALPNARVLYVSATGATTVHLPPITTFLNRLLALTIALQNTLFSVFDDLPRAKVEGAIASGAYDIGVETIIAERLVVTDCRTLYTHPQSGAEISVFTIIRRDRNRPFTLGEALERAPDRRAMLLINSQSKRAAVQVPAPSLIRDDGTLERRVRPLRPMERPATPLDDLLHRHWREADCAEFVEAWQAEIAAVPEFTDSNLHIVTRLLLPIWKRLPNDSMRVYRLQTHDGERIIGRLVSPAWVAEAVDADTPTLAPADAFAAVLDGRTVLRLQDGLELHRVEVMGEFRIELSAFLDGMVERPQSDRSYLGNHLLEASPVRADRHRRSGNSRNAHGARHPLVRLAQKTAA